jgi:hypothetical protein
MARPRKETTEAVSAGGAQGSPPAADNVDAIAVGRANDPAPATKGAAAGQAKGEPTVKEKIQEATQKIADLTRQIKETEAERAKYIEQDYAGRKGEKPVDESIQLDGITRALKGAGRLDGNAQSIYQLKRELQEMKAAKTAEAKP